ncbi:MAG: hypothetical protein M1831_006769 [Alyxoria varia]|nr:MAG: hypothetical protein M1831_006769 [Alyxoria varia]
MNDGNQDVSLEAAAAAAAAENGEVDLVAQAFKALPADGKRDGVEKVHNLVEPNRNAPFRPCQHHGPGVPMHCRVPHDDDDGKKGPCSSRDEQKARDQHERQEQLPSATMVGRAQRLQASKNLSKPFPSKNFSKPFAADDLTVSSSESLGPPPAPALAPARKERHVNETPVLRAQLESCHGNPPASKPVTAQPEFINLGKFEIDPPTLEKNQTAMMGITIRGPKIAIPAPSSSSSSYSKPARSNAGAILHNRSASPLLDSGGIVGGGGGGGGGGGSSSGSCSRSGVSGSSSGQKSQGWSLFPSPVPVKSPEYSLEVPRKSRFTEHIQTYQRLQADKGLAGKHMDLHGKCELKRQGARKKGRALDASV